MKCIGFSRLLAYTSVLVLANTLSPLVAPRTAATAEHPSLIGCAQANEHLVLIASAELDPNCTYTGGIEITNSGVLLDCRGAVIAATTEGADHGILITAPASVALHNITIRNCTVEGFLNSVRISRTGFRSLAPGTEYHEAHHDIVIEDSTFRWSRGVGVFIDAYVTRVTLQRLRIEGAGSSGIYLEAGSRDNLIADNVIVGNGFRQNGPHGQSWTLGNGVNIWFWGTGREGISVDGSRHNRIIGNRLERNSAGGVFLYKNCGEFAHQQPDRWWERRYGADDNLIEGNHFVGEHTGVWIGSRMSENPLPMDCSDPAYVEEPLVRVTLDRARGNRVLGNEFRDVTFGVRVEDDDTAVIANRFGGADPSQLAVVVGTRWRTIRLGRPVTGTTIVANTAQIAGNMSPYRWTYGHSNTTFIDNNSLDLPAVFCQAPPIPTNPFIFVLAFVAIDPNDQPPTSAINLALPRLPTLNPCTTELRGNVPIAAAPSFTG
ncbi:MAG: right-handed parallel beta-helix repeat-containing protein [Acidimicrobiales bacterium]|nr:right-handed parallel beta-helix repeat-containing protein [Acidimicrobiales bacterium]